MSNTKVERAIYLQKKANDQIDIYGEASHDVLDELMEIVDSLNESEQSLMLELYYPKMERHITQHFDLPNTTISEDILEQIIISI